jgi:hypothetical protein
MSVPVKEFLKNRRDRALGTVMGGLERDVWTRLDEEERTQVRRSVIDALNSYHDSVLDLLKAEDSNTVRNEELLVVLDRIDRKLGR